MDKFSATGTVDSLLSFYKHEQRIFGRCPHCKEPFRLSEVKLTYGKEPPRDLLARLKTDRDKLQEQLDELEAQIGDMEADHEAELDSVEETWKEKVELQVDKRLVTKVREIRQSAIAQSRAGQLGKTLEKIAPMFPGFGHHPSDVRPIFDPIDFVVFDGYFQGSVTGITFVEFKTGQSQLNRVQSSIRTAVAAKRVRFEERRIRKETLKMLTEGKTAPARKMIQRLVE